jgi:hypothetical protein
MSMSYVTMWGLLFLMVFGAVVGGLVHGDILAPYHDAYPSDPAKRAALDRCARTIPTFSRFEAADRDRCYGLAAHVAVDEVW